MPSSRLSSWPLLAAITSRSLGREGLESSLLGMHKSLWKSWVKPAGKSAEKLKTLYTNAQLVGRVLLKGLGYTLFVAQVFYSLIHVGFSNLYLLFKVVHTFPSAYNYNYIYKVNRRSA